MDLVALGWPEVKGAAEPEEAPEKATTPAVALEPAMVVLEGLRTLGRVSLNSS